MSAQCPVFTKANAEPRSVQTTASASVLLMSTFIGPAQTSDFREGSKGHFQFCKRGVPPPPHAREGAPTAPGALERFEPASGGDEKWCERIRPFLIETADAVSAQRRKNVTDYQRLIMAGQPCPQVNPRSAALDVAEACFFACRGGVNGCVDALSFQNLGILEDFRDIDFALVYLFECYFRKWRGIWPSSDMRGSLPGARASLASLLT